MTSPVVIVSRDIPLGRTEVRWYLDLTDWERRYPLATVDAAALWIDRAAPAEVARQAAALFLNELAGNRCADLSWLATHRIEANVPVPVRGSAA